MLLRRLAPVLACSLVLAGCMTGERPSFSTDPVDDGSSGDPVDATSVDDPAIAAVLAHLTDPPAGDAPVVAEYDVVRKFGGDSARVVLARDTDRWSLTIGELRYLDIGGERSTCDLPTGQCDDGFDEARLSDVLTSTEFATDAAALRIRRSDEDVIGEARPSRRRIAGVRATCADVDVPGGTVQWCTAPQGLLALQDTADMRVELVSLVDAVDPVLFTTTAR
jgi:hypothetical protein